MKAVVDRETCTGCGLCEETCPQVFKLEDGVAAVQIDPVPRDCEKSCREAAGACPVDNISIPFPGPFPNMLSLPASFAWRASSVARQAKVEMKQPAATPHPRAADLTAARNRLQREIVRRQAAEAALKKSQERYAELLAQSRLGQEQQQHLSHQILLA